MINFSPEGTVDQKGLEICCFSPLFRALILPIFIRQFVGQMKSGCRERREKLGSEFQHNLSLLMAVVLVLVSPCGVRIAGSRDTTWYLQSSSSAGASECAFALFRPVVHVSDAYALEASRFI